MLIKLHTLYWDFPIIQFPFQLLLFGVIRKGLGAKDVLGKLDYESVT